MSALSTPPSPRLGPLFLAAAALGGALAAAAPARAQQEQTVRSALQVRAGEIRQVGVFGGHGRNCITSVPPNAIQVVQAPKLGTLSQRVGVPYNAQNSLSGTCGGMPFLGTAVDYTARTPGTDTVALDVVFGNGTSHRLITITVLPE